MFKKVIKIFITALSICLFIVMGCAEPVELKVEEVPEITRAIAIIHPVGENSVSGIIRFEQSVAGIKIFADVQGLSPGNHGFHIHEFGDCHAPDAKSAGGHFNPDNNAHGGPLDIIRHIGDLGNLSADENGNAHLEKIDTRISLSGSQSVIGRAIIIHANEDDYKSQPTGNAGARVACGVIGVAASKSENLK